MTNSAGEDRTLRRWRVALTVFSWLFIVQSGVGFVSSLLSIPFLASLRPESLAAQLGPLFADADLATIDALYANLRTLNLAQALLSGSVLVGAIGLLLRKRWGWYLTVVLNALQAVAALAFGPPALEQVLAIVDPASAGRLSWIVAGLIALIPAWLVVFLMLKPIVDQFEHQTRDTATETR